METKKQDLHKPEKIAIDTKKLVFNADTKKEFLLFLKQKEDRLEGMLLWCSIIVLVSYVALVLGIIKYYATFTNQHPMYLVVLLLLVIVMLGAFIKLQYRHTTYKPLCSALAVKELLNFKAHVAAKHLKLLRAYIIAYSVIVGGACLLCWYSAEKGAQNILTLTTPFSIMVYGCGLFLLIKLMRKRRAYLNYICAIDESIIKQFDKQ